MRKALLIIVLSFTTTLNYAQSGSEKMHSDSLTRSSHGIFFNNHKFTIGEKQITKNEAYAILMNYQPSAIELKEYKKYNDLTVYTGVAAVSFLVASLIANGDLQSKAFNNTSSKILLGIGCGLIIPEGVFAVNRNKHYKRSIKLYNQQFQ